MTYLFDPMIWDDSLMRMTLKHVTEISNYKKIIAPLLFSLRVL